MLFVLIMLGSAIFISALLVHVRLRAFEHKFRDVTKFEGKGFQTRNLSYRSRPRRMFIPRTTRQSQEDTRGRPSERFACLRDGDVIASAGVFEHVPGT